MKRLSSILALVAIAALLGCGPKDASKTESAAAESSTAEAGLPAGCILGPNAMIGGPITLVDQSGAEVTQDNFHEGMTLVYFGYTFCPDVCPLALQSEKATLAVLGEKAQVIQPVMISLDPKRDTPQQMASYVSSPAFPKGLTGLTGTAEQVDKAAKAFRVAYERQDDAGSAAAYAVSHTSMFYLMDENWRLAALYPSDLKPKEAAACIAEGLKREENPT
jgi:protein SCO1/2